MGFFKKMKDSFDAGQANLANTQAMRQQYQQQQAAGAAEGMIGMQGMAADPAAFGGPSTQPLSPDDPMLQPVNGIGLEEYAQVAKAAQAQGISDEAGLCALAEQMGIASAADMQVAVTEWVARMQRSMVVGQQFNRIYRSM